MPRSSVNTIAQDTENGNDSSLHKLSDTLGKAGVNLHPYNLPNMSSSRNPHPFRGLGTANVSTSSINTLAPNLVYDEEIGAEEGSLQEALARARSENIWVRIGNTPPIPDEHVRLYRGVAPLAIETEFAEPLSPEEWAAYDTLFLKSQTVGPSGLNTEESLKLYKYMKAAVNGRDRFFADDLKIAQRYAHGGIVYYLDVLASGVYFWYRENGLPESAFAVPFDIASNSRVYAVGPQIPQGVELQSALETPSQVN